MAKSPAAPFSPTVSAVFVAFLKKLEVDETCDQTTLANLRKAFDEQALDAQSLREALFENQQGQKP